MSKELSSMRSHYKMGELLKSEVAKDPFVQFNHWMQDAVLDNLFEPNALSLATVDENGQPSCRTVLLKGILQEGYIFYTNYSSKKGIHIQHNDQAAMLFWWREHERQVRIEGTISKLPAELSSDYFNERPKGSRISAMISPQSQIIEDRNSLSQWYMDAEQKYADEDPVCPEFWGGFILEPKLFEFWQGRPNRLHDRLEYSRHEGNWTINRLAP